MKLGDKMKTLVAYYSKSGHTKSLAQTLANELSADLDEIQDKKDRKGVLNFIKSGKEAVNQTQTQISFSRDPSQYEQVIVGTPVWAGFLPPATLTYLTKNKQKLPNPALLISSGSGKNEKLLPQAEKITGKTITQSIEIGNSEQQKNQHIEKLKQFAQKLKS